MNINVTLKALDIQAPSSNPMPTFPLRSARPRLSNRPVRVTIPAPRITPTIPSTGLWERSAGSVARPEDAAAGGRPVETLMGVVLITRLLPGPHRYHRRQARSQLRSKRRVIDGDLHRHSLHDFGEIACGVIRRQQRKLRAASGCDLEHSTLEYLVRININANLCPVPDSNVGQLRLTKICCDPPDVFDKRHHLCSGAYELSRTHLTLTDGAVRRRNNSCVA